MRKKKEKKEQRQKAENVKERAKRDSKRDIYSKQKKIKTGEKERDLPYVHVRRSI